jgi:membrane protein implicated in regulation of membrane protease activity
MIIPFLYDGNAMWAWLAAGAVLLVMEIVLPGAFLLWLGVAAVLTGLVLPVLDFGFGFQLGLFAVLSIALGIFARVVLRYGVSVSDRGILNKAANRFLGQIVLVVEPIVNGRGKVKVGDTLWNAEGPDAAEGARVKVTGASGTVLRVERT